MTNKGRMYVRVGCFLLATLLLLPFPFWMDGSRVFVHASSFITMGTILAGGTIWVGSILGLAFAAIALVRKRWFCRHICPVGLILDTVSGTKLPVRIWWRRSPAIGKYIVFLTAGGALLGYPLFLWMDPLAFLNNAFSVYGATGVVSVLASLSGMVVLLLLTMTSGDLWCARICPLGATQDLLENFGSFCRNLRKPKRTESGETAAQGNAVWAARRMFLAVAAGLGSSLVARKIGEARSDRAPLRPPGAIREDEFTGLCLRCGNCMRACPSRIIHPDKGQSGVLGFLSPVVRFERDYCRNDCNACTAVCPSGALQGLSLEQKNRYVIGKASVDPSLCLWGVSECQACIGSCPYEAIKIQWYEEAYESFPTVDPSKCNGCGACEAVCPTGDLKAVKVSKTKD
ncbi:MAG: 4Fe-4S dicluster domain-containing protein [Acidobacteria bacterium]|nr:4Fe-4S dicluster domain-containing protein [Acidobacteriota bacterium]